MLATWQHPLWGSVNQVSVGGAGPAATGCSFIMCSRLESPIGTLESIPGLGSQADGDGAFTAPHDMKLKAWSDRITLAGGYRQDISFYYRVNGGAEVLLATVAALTTDWRIHQEDISFLAGDEIEILYTCGNNFNMGVGLAFFFEDDAATSQGPFWIGSRTQSNTSASDISVHFGGVSASYNVLPIAPVTFAIRRAYYGLSAVPTVDHTVAVSVNGVDETLGTLTQPATKHLFDDIDKVVLAGQKFGFKVNGGAASEPVVFLTSEMEVLGRDDATNVSTSLFFSGGDMNAAGNLHVSKVVAPAAGTIKEITVASPFAHSNNIYVAVNGGATTTLITYTAVSGGIDSALPNFAFLAGDELVFSHDGTGVTGAGLAVTLNLELANGNDYVSPTYTAPGTDQAAGDEAEPIVDDGQESSSSFNMKGNFFMCAKEDRFMTGITGRSGLAGYTIKYRVWEVDASYQMVSLIHDGASFTSIDGWETETLGTPILLEAGKTYCFGAIRTDDVALRWFFDADPISSDLNEQFWYVGATRQTDYTPLVGDDMYYEMRDAWTVWPITEKAAPAFKFALWSILCEGSADATSQGFAALAVRDAHGGADLIAEFETMYDSANNASFPAANVLDGSAATRWKFDEADYAVLADRRIILGNTVHGVDLVSLDITATNDGNHDETPTAFKIQFSYDGVQWETAKTVTGEAAWTSGETRTYDITVAPTDPATQDHEYWAIHCYDSDNTAYLAICQIEMMEVAAGADVTTTGFAISGANRVGWEDTKAFDNDFTTASKAWGIQYSAHRKRDRWCGQNFGVANGKNIVEVTLTARNDTFEEQAPRLFAIMFSDDGVDWRISWIVNDDTNWTAGETRTYTKP